MNKEHKIRSMEGASGAMKYSMLGRTHSILVSGPSALKAGKCALNYIYIYIRPPCPVPVEACGSSRAQRPALLRDSDKTPSGVVYT